MNETVEGTEKNNQLWTRYATTYSKIANIEQKMKLTVLVEFKKNKQKTFHPKQDDNANKIQEITVSKRR